MRNRALVCAVASCFVLSGCIEGSIIQLKYNRKRDECRTIAELRADTLGAHPIEPQRVPINPDIFTYAQAMPAASQVADRVPKPLSPREKSTQLARAYNDCMSDQGWTIANPQKDKDGEKK